MTDALMTMHASCSFPGVQCVISSSSGRGEFIPWTGDLGRVIKSIVLYAKMIEFVPFIHKEFEAYKEVFAGSYELKDEEYYELTHYNPSLLAAVGGLNLEAATARVNEVVRKTVDGYLSSLRANKFALIQRSLPSSINMLVCAANNISLLVKPNMTEYKFTWVHAESMTYISNLTDKEFTLSMNFPTCYNILLEMLCENRNENGIKVHSSIIDGFRFEVLICSAISRLDILYSKKDGLLGRQPDGKSIVFQFESQISMQESALPFVNRLMNGTLVHLRPCHPVMDAVAYITKEDIPWLLFVQVSLSEYDDHKSKAMDVYNEVQGCERNTEHCSKWTGKMTWIDYYCSLLPEDVQPNVQLMYVYISPKNFVEGSVETLKQYTLRDLNSNARQVFLGMIQNSSDSAMFIAAKEAEAKC
jgi:hypothetical protein